MVITKIIIDGIEYDIQSKMTGELLSDAASISVVLSPNSIAKIPILTLCSNLTISLDDGLWSDEYGIIFTTGSTAPTVSFPASITKWIGGAPTIAANKRYEVSILDGTGVVSSV